MHSRRVMLTKEPPGVGKEVKKHIVRRVRQLSKGKRTVFGI
jgi:hypothetical protein